MAFTRNEEIYQQHLAKVAASHGVTPQELEHQFQQALDDVWTKDGREAIFLNSQSIEGERPTPREFFSFMITLSFLSDRQNAVFRHFFRTIGIRVNTEGQRT